MPPPRVLLGHGGSQHGLNVGVVDADRRLGALKPAGGLHGSHQAGLHAEKDHLPGGAEITHCPIQLPGVHQGGGLGEGANIGLQHLCTRVDRPPSGAMLPEGTFSWSPRPCMLRESCILNF